MTESELPRFVQGLVEDFLADPQNNNLGPGWTDEIAWQDFLLGYSTGDDALYSFWKSHIGPFHWSPDEAFAMGATPEAREHGAAAPAAPADPTQPASAADRGAVEPPPPGELTVVSWALSHTEAAKADNREERELPSQRWARTRIYGQSHNRALHRALVAALALQGYSAVAPSLLPEYGEKQSEEQGRSSNWSERHVAYTSGLGTFGLCGGLITELGQAVRFGSVVVHARIPPTERPYAGPFDYCLYFDGVDCTACIDRCPVAATEDDTRRKVACAEHLEVTTADFVESEFGFEGYGCGLCQTGVPCESTIPVARP